MYFSQLVFLLLVGAVAQAIAGALLSENTPFNVTNCSRRSAAIHNLTVYGTEILYTPVTVGNGTGKGTGNVTLTNTTGVDTATSFEFQMYNAVLDVDAQCSTHVPQQESNASVWHDCFVESRDTRITAAFQFDLSRHTLTINETWVCDDGVNETARTFQAWATNSIAVLCNETVNTAFEQHYCARVPDTLLPVNVTSPET
ncbi:hypothetical protein SBRCBS47491_005456 [Sporothrix bragantina]|uniref:AA1-like domain-containing protein n=1 Tax=Sporothrix bragantina TaxID=671064 RepID=A0ABP0BYR7_9PEZI